jgi:hypothetical protein
MNEIQTIYWDKLKMELYKKGWTDDDILEMTKYCFIIGWIRGEYIEKIERDYKEWENSLI